MDLRFGARRGPLDPAGRARGSSASPACTRSSTTRSSRPRARSAALSPDAFILVGGHAAAAFPGPLAGRRDRRDLRGRRRGGRPGARRRARRGPAARRRPGAALLHGRDGWIATRAARRTARASTTCRCPRAISSSATATATTACSSSPSGSSRRRAAARSAATSARSGSSTAARSASGRSARSWTTSRRSATASSSPTISSGTTRSAASSSRRRCSRRGIRKRWILVQTRTDLVCRHPELLEAWRPLAKDFDIFFGLEAASDAGLASVAKDAGVCLVDRGGADLALDGLRRDRQLPRRPGLGRGAVPGALGLRRDARLPARRLHDPDAAAGHRALPEARARSLAGQPWFKYDMHHVLWEPRLGARRFFELYAETWRRSILNTSGEKSWIDWMRQVRPAQIPYLTRVLLRTQRMMKAAGVPEGARGHARRARAPRRRRRSRLPEPRPRSSSSSRTGETSLAPPDRDRRAARSASGQALLARDLAASPSSRLLLALRGYGRARPRGAQAGRFADRLERFGFTQLARGLRAASSSSASRAASGAPTAGSADRRFRTTFGLRGGGCVKAAWNLAWSTRAGNVRARPRRASQYFGAPPAAGFGSTGRSSRPFSGAIRIALLQGRTAARRGFVARRGIDGGQPESTGVNRASLCLGIAREHG